MYTKNLEKTSERPHLSQSQFFLVIGSLPWHCKGTVDDQINLPTQIFEETSHEEKTRFSRKSTNDAAGSLFAVCSSSPTSDWCMKLTDRPSCSPKIRIQHMQINARTYMPNTTATLTAFSCMLLTYCESNDHITDDNGRRVEILIQGVLKQEVLQAGCPTNSAKALKD